MEGVSGGQLDGAIAALAALEGVRTVREGDVVVSSTDTTSPPTTAPAGTTPSTLATTTTTLPALQAASLTATLEPGSFRLSGVVLDQQIADRLLEAANIAYAPFVESDLVVSADVDAPPWLNAAPTGLSLLPMITDGTISVSGGQIR